MASVMSGHLKVMMDHAYEDGQVIWITPVVIPVACKSKWLQTTHKGSIGWCKNQDSSITVHSSCVRGGQSARGGELYSPGSWYAKDWATFGSRGILKDTVGVSVPATLRMWALHAFELLAFSRVFSP